MHINEFIQLWWSAIYVEAGANNRFDAVRFWDMGVWGFQAMDAELVKGWKLEGFAWTRNEIISGILSGSNNDHLLGEM